VKGIGGVVSGAKKGGRVYQTKKKGNYGRRAQRALTSSGRLEDQGEIQGLGTTLFRWDTKKGGGMTDELKNKCKGRRGMEVGITRGDPMGEVGLLGIQDGDREGAGEGSLKSNV